MEDEEIKGQSVLLYAYDLCKISLNQESYQIPEGVWFTSVVIFNKEYYFNKNGIESCRPGETTLGPEATKIENIGNTEISFSLFFEYIILLSETKYKSESFRLRDLDSQSFTDEICQFLCSERVPKYVLYFPQESENEELIANLITSVGFTEGSKHGVSFDKKSYLFEAADFKRTPREPSPDWIELERQIEELKKVRIPLKFDKSSESGHEEVRIKKNKKVKRRSPSKDKRRKKVAFKEEAEIIVDRQERNMSEERVENPIPQDGEESTETPKKPQKPREPVVTFRDFDHSHDFEDLVRTIVTLISAEEQDRLREMEDWIIKNEGTWVLAEGFNAFLGRVLHDASLPSQGRVAMLRLMAYGASQDDIVLILHMDRKDHLVMNYAQEFDRLPIREQEATALLFANLFETNSASEWLLYISEWTLASLNLSNIRVTTKVAVNALLGDTPVLQDYGAAIMHNLSTKEVKAVVFDDVCTELAMAILQYFNGNPKEENVFYCMKALNKFCNIAHREVPQLVKMIGPEPSKFNGVSSRVDELIQQINTRLAAIPGF